MHNGDESDEKIQVNFLSPSVREYLELGKSIPGKNYIVCFNIFFFESSIHLIQSKYFSSFNHSVRRLLIICGWNNITTRGKDWP